MDSSVCIFYGHYMTINSEECIKPCGGVISLGCWGRNGYQFIFCMFGIALHSDDDIVQSDYLILLHKYKKSELWLSPKSKK